MKYDANLRNLRMSTVLNAVTKKKSFACIECNPMYILRLKDEKERKKKVKKRRTKDEKQTKR